MQKQHVFFPTPSLAEFGQYDGRVEWPLRGDEQPNCLNNYPKQQLKN